MKRYALRGRIIDAVSDTPIEDGLLVIEGERIAYVGAYDAAKIPEGAQVLQVENGTILPGFIDCHAHLTGQTNAGDFSGGRLFGDQLLGAAYQCGLLLDSGFTGIRDMSVAGCYLSRAVERGVLRGPRIMPGGQVISNTSGHLDLDISKTKEEQNSNSPIGCLVDGPVDAMLGVRKQFRMGAKFIKICATGGVSSPTDRVDDVAFSDEEFKAIVEEAKRHHTYVCAHCTGNEGAYKALQHGVTCIEHGVFLTQREIDLMKEMNATLVTTLSVSLGVANIPGLPNWMAEKARNCANANKNTIRMAREAGVRIALGTDYSNSRNSPFTELGKEFEAMTRAGMTNMEAIKAGTINAAYLMMNDQETGSLEAGKLADVVIVDGNPLEDIWVLCHADHVKAVFLGGKMQKNSI